MSFLAASADGSFPESLPVNELFEFPAFLFKDSTWLAMNRTGMLYLLAAVITVVLLTAGFSNSKVVPGRLQAGMEQLYEFIKNDIAGQVIGKGGEKFVPFLLSLFLFIFVCNFFEIMPFVNFPPTSRMAVPALLALSVWVVFIAAGIKAQGLGGYLKGVAIPPGVPGPILVLVIPIEIVSTFVLRPFTHAVRLFANMMAGHILLAVTFLASNAFLFTFINYDNVVGGLNVRGLPVGIIAFAGAVAFVAFEFVVGLLQAYIFTILTAVYLSGSLSPHH